MRIQGVRKGPASAPSSVGAWVFRLKQRLDFDMFGDGSLWIGLLQKYPLAEEIQHFYKVAKVIFGEMVLRGRFKGEYTASVSFYGEELNLYIRPVMRPLHIIILISF
jgi:hypothetical protein